jgi:hypothetical protein
MNVVADKPRGSKPLNKLKTIKKKGKKPKARPFSIKVKSMQPKVQPQPGRPTMGFGDDGSGMKARGGGHTAGGGTRR